MKEAYAYGATEDPSSLSFSGPFSPLTKLRHLMEKETQRVLDKTVPLWKQRWSFWLFCCFVYVVRAKLARGYYIVTYGLGIYNLNLVIGFISPARDPGAALGSDALEDAKDDAGPTLPTKNDAEYRPFVRKLPEFKFWLRSTKSLFVSFAMTFFPMFDVPVFWPILLMYFVMLFTMTMKQQLKHMIKHKYVPFSWGKQTYRKGGNNNKAMGTSGAD